MGASPDIPGLRMRWVAVFATGRLTGNPLAVVPCESHPPGDTMQALPAAFGRSETVFAAREQPAALRIVTPAMEIPMAGYPLMGAAWGGRDEGWIGAGARVTTRTRDVTVRPDPWGTIG